MKKFSVLALTAMLALSFAACSSSSEVKKEDAKPAVVVPVVDPKVACKADADKKFDACVAAAKTAKAKKACETTKTKAYADCDKPAATTTTTKTTTTKK